MGPARRTPGTHVAGPARPRILLDDPEGVGVGVPQHLVAGDRIVLQREPTAGGHARDARGRLTRLLGPTYAPYGYRKVRIKDGARERPKLELDPPDAPTAVAAYSIRTTELEVRWSTSDASSTTSFKIQWKSGSEEFDSSRQLTSDPATSIQDEQTTSSGKRYKDTLTGLTDRTEYTVRVIAANSNGDSGPSAEAFGTALPGPYGPLRFIRKEVVEIFESSHPWLRQAYDYIRSASVDVAFHSEASSSVWTQCSPDRPMESNLRKCYATSVTIGRASPNLIYEITHELAHVYTLSNGVASTPGSNSAVISGRTKTCCPGTASSSPIPRAATSTARRVRFSRSRSLDWVMSCLVRESGWWMLAPAPPP